MNPYTEQRFSLETLPAGTSMRSVTAEPGSVDGRRGTRVRLTDKIARDGVPGVDYVDQPTLVLLPVEIETGRLSIDLHSQLTDDAPDYARGFAGLAFHAAPAFDRFEAIYLRPTNGTLMMPGPPRDQRSIQYFAYPDWPFDRLRSERPDQGLEAPAPIAPGRWCQLVIDIEPDHVSASVDGTEVLRTDVLVPPQTGRIGLFVDIGTDAHFADLTIARGETRQSGANTAGNEHSKGSGSGQLGGR